MPKKKSRQRPFEDARVAIPYVRQSRGRIGETEDTALSLESQEAAIRERLSRDGYAVEPAIRDHDEDSESPDRPGLHELYRRIRPGVTVAVEFWDRLGRGWILGAINAEIEKRGGRAVSITQGADSLTRDLHAALGGQYLDQLSDRLHSVTAARVSRGIHVGAVPFGYDKPGRIGYTDKHGTPKTRHTGPLTVAEDHARIVKRIFARWVSGDSLRRIALDLSADGIEAPHGLGRVGNRNAGGEQADGRLAAPTLDDEHDGAAFVEVHPTGRQPGVLESGDDDELVSDAHPNGLHPAVSEVAHGSILPQWTPNTIAWMLKNPVYAGGVRMRGAIVWDAQHEPIVDRATWDAAQLRFARSVPVRIKTESHWCEGLVRHSCGSRMLLNLVQRPGGGTYPSFRCAASARVPKGCADPRQHIGAPLLERAVRACLARDLESLLSVDEVVRLADAGGARAAAVAERARLDAERAALEDEYLRSRRAWLALNEPDAVWRAEKDRFDALFAGIDRRLAALPVPVDRGAIAERAAVLAGIAPLLRDPRAGGDRLREHLSRLGEAVVGADGVYVKYWPEWEEHVRDHAVVDPRMRSA